MRIEIPDTAVAGICGLLGREGHAARLVGGAVRDLARGEIPKDMDIATDALPEQVMAIARTQGLRVVETGLKHGTVTVMVDRRPYEVTTLRKDVETDGRHARVEYVSDFKVDAARRDFTMNAMSASPDGQVFDYFRGLDDLKSGIVRFVGNADDRIAEDYLRILRFFRFRARFGAPGVEGDIAAVARGKHGLARISPERIWSEVSRIAVLPGGMGEIQAMHASGVSEAIGFNIDPLMLLNAGRVAIFGGRPGTVVGTLCRGSSAAERLAEAWKLSNAEAEDAAVAAAVVQDAEQSPGYWIGLVADGIAPDRIAPVLMATGRLEAGMALKGSIPSFPLRGKDLLEAGFEPGPSVGEALAAARAEWKASDFKATREDLLASLSTSPGSRRP